jgi:acyl-CoA synthetase (AMP-forming)/AMP-acid ligase II
MTTADAPAGEVTVTQRLLDSAAARDGRTALAGGTVSPAYTYPGLAVLLQRAAAGLAWRGVRPRDVVGVYVDDAAAYIVACHAVRAAGGVPSPVCPHTPVTEAAGQLADCGARILITTRSLAALALAAADRSWVRQVISFGEAPGATPFTTLLNLGTMRPHPVRAHDLALLPYARRRDGTLGQAGVTHLDLSARLLALCTDAGLTECDVVLAAPPAGDKLAYTAYVDHALLRGALVVPAAPGELPAAARAHQGTAAIVTPDADPAGLASLAGSLRTLTVPWD